MASDNLSTPLYKLNLRYYLVHCCRKIMPTTLTDILFIGGNVVDLYSKLFINEETEVTSQKDLVWTTSTAYIML